MRTGPRLPLRSAPAERSRRPGRALLAAAAPALLWGCAPAPNLVVIVVDTLRADKLGSYGEPRPTSPELDRLAARGVRFARVVAPSSWTRPSVASLLTALHPRSLGIYDEPRHVLDDRFATLPELLREHGYRTLGATANPNINSAYNFHQGFDDYLDSDVLWSWMPAEPGKRRGDEVPMATSRQLFDHLLARVAEAPPGPTYLQACVMEVHGSFGEGVVREPYRSRFQGVPEALYLGAIAQVSQEIDRFVAELSARPGWEHTLFVVTSDHGQGLFDHPHVAESRLHGRLLYASHTLVPLILFETEGSLPRGAVVERPVRLLDLAPTLLDYAGLPIPEGLEGLSLLPLLRGQPVALPAAFVAETQYRDMDKIAAYAGEWEYILSRDGHAGTGPSELQREGRVADGSRTDVARHFPRVAQELASFLDAWEASHPRTHPTLQQAAPDPAELEQLRALGYLP